VESNTDFEQKTSEAKFDQAPAVKTFSSGREASIGGSGGKVIRPVAGSTDDGRSGPSSSQQIRYAGTPSTVARDEDVMSVSEEDEEDVWNNMVGEARQMQASFGDESLVDPDILKWMVNPMTVQLERDDYIDYTRTDLDYQLAVQMDPQNSLLLANFAHFLQVVLRDHKRAEYFYKKAIACVPADGEAFSKYANFLWLVKNDTEAAEENFLEALIADSGNSYIAASYAHFLWNTGGTDTCFAG
jgi:tetratricopeptide (TPR) repeat protein